jgi:hypothetical protein
MSDQQSNISQMPPAAHAQAEVHKMATTFEQYQNPVELAEIMNLAGWQCVARIAGVSQLTVRMRKLVLEELRAREAALA